MARTLENIHATVESLRRASAERDQRYHNVHDIRSGDIDSVIPGSMPDAWPKPIVANLIDTSARDTAEVMGTMPSINCSAGSMSTDKAKKFSSKKTKIANYYVQCAGLGAGRQVTAADYYNTYGMVIYSIEPDFENERPHIRVENPMGVYPEFDLFGQLKSYTKVWREQAIHLAAKFPHLLRMLQSNETGGERMGWAEREIEVVKYCDAQRIVMYLPHLGNQLVHQMDNPMDKVYVSIGKRPGFDSQTRGAYDDAGWVQLAKARFALLGMESAEKAVRAAMVVPRDVTQMQVGDDKIIRTDNPAGVAYVAPQLPPAAFQQGAALEQELRTGARAPEGRSGNIDASVITGRGVEALMGGFNTVITTGQTVLAEALKAALELCFEMDQKLWGSKKKTVRGMVQGTPFEETYVPKKDIAGDYTVDVTYGFGAGDDPARAVVMMLQLRGDQLISRDFFQRQLPMQIDVVEMQAQIDNEQLLDALKQGVMGYAQSIPQMAMQGQDPVEGLARMAKLIDLRAKGSPIQDAILKVFTPKEQPAANPLAPPAPGAPAPGGAPAGPGGEVPQGIDLQSLLSGLTGEGKTSMSVRSQRQAPI
jgi:hypothetical protein